METVKCRDQGDRHHCREMAIGVLALFPLKIWENLTKIREKLPGMIVLLKPSLALRIFCFHLVLFFFLIIFRAL